ncbi:hypothetical protein [Clostridium hydrogenum]|uniref:hypothetical protein n=1 Tax=Clostridium hydrogenum TaxID=2855764 RepID=UPI001F385185|nr:hypothetical protein [Clostridium hydrogenum]
MITIYTLEEIKELRDISEAMKEELLSYFEESAKASGIASATLWNRLPNRAYVGHIYVT